MFLGGLTSLKLGLPKKWESQNLANWKLMIKHQIMGYKDTLPVFLVSLCSNKPITMIFVSGDIGPSIFATEQVLETAQVTALLVEPKVASIRRQVYDSCPSCIYIASC